MKGTIRILLFSVLFLLALNIWQMIRLGRMDTDNKEAAKNALAQKELLIRRIFLHMDYAAPFRLDPASRIQNDKGDSLSLKEIISAKKRVVLKVSKLNCGSCIEFELDKLKKGVPGFTDSSIILLADDYTLNELRNLKKNNHVDLPVFRLLDSHFHDLSFTSLNFPVYFIMDTSLMATHVFFPDKYQEFLTDEYYQIVTYLFKQQGQGQYVNVKTSYNTRIRLSEPIADLGKVKKGDSSVAVFTIQNIGDRPLIINDLKTSCGCTAAVISTKEVAAGQSARVKVTYTADNKGAFSRNVTIYSNAENYNPCTLVIKGVVI